MLLFRKANRAPGLPKLTAQERTVARLLFQAVDKIRSQTSREDVLAALNRNDVARAVQEIRWAAGEDFLASTLPKQYRSVYDVAGEAGIKRLNLDTRFDVVSQPAVRFARERSGALIQEWGDSSRDALRAMVSRAIQDGIPPRPLGRMIVEDGIGLTERQALAVERFRTSLEGNEDLDLTEDQLEFRVGRYSRELLRSRGETIARTELIQAAREGEQESWRQAMDRGLLDPESFMQEWSVAEDERLCEVCAELDGEQAALGEQFPGDGGYGPPAHPNCRCSLIARP